MRIPSASSVAANANTPSLNASTRVRSRCRSRAISSPHRPYLDRPSAGDGMLGCDIHGLFEAVALDQVEPAHRLLRLDEGTIGDDRSSVAHADRAGPARRRQLVSDDPPASRLKVVE